MPECENNRIISPQLGRAHPANYFCETKLAADGVIPAVGPPQRRPCPTTSDLISLGAVNLIGEMLGRRCRPSAYL